MNLNLCCFSACKSIWLAASHGDGFSQSRLFQYKVRNMRYQGFQGQIAGLIDFLTCYRSVTIRKHGSTMITDLKNLQV